MRTLKHVAGAKRVVSKMFYLYWRSYYEGVEKLLQNMHDEINRNMILMGCKNLGESIQKLFTETKNL